jgi:hypothetical protein
MGGSGHVTGSGTAWLSGGSAHSFFGSSTLLPSIYFLHGSQSLK